MTVFKGVVHPKRNRFCHHSRVIPNLYELLTSVEHKTRYTNSLEVYGTQKCLINILQHAFLFIPVNRHRVIKDIYSFNCGCHS